MTEHAESSAGERHWGCGCPLDELRAAVPADAQPTATPRTNANIWKFAPMHIPPEGLRFQVTTGDFQLVSADFSRELERALIAAAKREARLEALLREWLSTELDTMDEEFEPWIQSFTARTKAALAKEPDK